MTKIITIVTRTYTLKIRETRLLTNHVGLKNTRAEIPLTSIFRKQKDMKLEKRIQKRKKLMSLLLFLHSFSLSLTFLSKDYV